MNTEHIIRENYDLVWRNFLQLEIKRSCEAVKLLRSANSYLVLHLFIQYSVII